MPSQIVTCACGCGGDPGVYVVTNYHTGARKGDPRRYCIGHSRKGVKLSAEARAKITGRPISSNDPCTIHQWLNKHHPKAGRCSECGREGKTDYAYKHHPQPHTRNIEDYDELCRSCHFRRDEAVVGRGPQLASSATREQRQAAGRKGAAVRWRKGEDVGALPREEP
jgi:hypothetical protein